MLPALALAAALLARSADLLGEGAAAPPIAAWSGRFEGHVTIVDFTATWCPHCREALADETRFMAAYGDRVQLVLVDVKEDPTIVRTFFSRVPVPANAALLVDPAGETASAWRVTAFPTIYLVDENARVLESWTGWGDRSRHHLQRLMAARDKKSARGPIRARAVSSDRVEEQAAEDAEARRQGVQILR